MNRYGKWAPTAFDSVGAFLGMVHGATVSCAAEGREGESQ